jgi:restriction endonuclease S subunit
MEKLDSILKYYQPTTFIVEKDDYDDNYKTPVLTAGKSFILGYTKEETGIFSELPAIIFDDFTTSFHYVDFPFKVKSSAMKILVPRNENIDLRYVYYRMQGLRVDTELHKRYWISIYSQFPIPLPPLETQKRIAQILDDAQALKSKTELLLKEYDALAQSIFLDMFGDPVTNPKGFFVKCLKEFYVNEKNGIKCGPFGGALKKEEYVDEGIAVWNMDNISKNGVLNHEINLWIDEEKFQKLKSYSVINGDIIISRAGTVGKMCVVDSSFKKSIISTNLIRLRLNQERLLPLYFSSLMNYFKDRVGRLKTGSEGSFTHMNTGVLNELNFPYPPISLQNQFAEKIALIEQQKELAKKELKESEDLFNCLMQKAFKGEIVCK